MRNFGFNTFAASLPMLSDCCVVYFIQTRLNYSQIVIRHHLKDEGRYSVTGNLAHHSATGDFKF